MKQNVNCTFVVSVFICLLVACYDDKGSYNYKDVNEIEVDGLEESYSVIFKKDTLEIIPKLKFTQDSLSLDRYEYEWCAKFYTTSAEDETRKIIGSERNLKYFVELEPGSYRLYLKVRDKQTGLLWMNNTTTLTVRTRTDKGWLLIGEDAGGFANVDMITMASDTVVVRNLLQNNGLPVLESPGKIIYTGRVTSSSRKPYERLWIATKNRSYYLDPSTLKGSRLNTFEPLVYSYLDLPEQLNPVHVVSQGRAGSASSSRITVCAEGHVFYITSFYLDTDYGNPLNRTVDAPNVLFKAFPYIFVSFGYPSGGIIYDTDNNRFMRFASALNSIALLDNNNEVFPWIQPEGRMLIYGENTMDYEGGGYGNSYALMKDAAGYYIYKFYAQGNAPQKWAGYEIKNSLAKDIDKAKLFAFASKRSLLLYVVDKTLYAYDFKKGYEKIYSMEMEDEITMIEFDIVSEYNASCNDLYIATYSSTTGGTLQKYVLGTDQNTFELKPDEHCRWTGLVKVKDMEWKNSK